MEIRTLERLRRRRDAKRIRGMFGGYSGAKTERSLNRLIDAMAEGKATSYAKHLAEQDAERWDGLS
jgi:hypothetical protein